MIITVITIIRYAVKASYRPVWNFLNYFLAVFLTIIPLVILEWFTQRSNELVSVLNHIIRLLCGRTVFGWKRNSFNCSGLYHLLHTSLKTGETILNVSSLGCVGENVPFHVIFKQKTNYGACKYDQT